MFRDIQKLVETTASSHEDFKATSSIHWVHETTESIRELFKITASKHLSTAQTKVSTFEVPRATANIQKDFKTTASNPENLKSCEYQ
jgi:hypothetical protein